MHNDNILCNPASYVPSFRAKPKFSKVNDCDLDNDLSDAISSTHAGSDVNSFRNKNYIVIITSKGHCHLDSEISDIISCMQVGIDLSDQQA